MRLAVKVCSQNFELLQLDIESMCKTVCCRLVDVHVVEEHAIVFPGIFLPDRIKSFYFLLHVNCFLYCSSQMDFQEQFFKEQIKYIHEARDEKEESFEKLQQQQREKVKQSNPNPSNTEEYRRRYTILLLL